MNDFLTIKIIGLDPKRYPNVVNSNYIDIIYKLSEKAPNEWCAIFNDIFKDDKNVRIDQDSGQFIDTWVRDMDDIPEKFILIKDGVELSNQKYHDKLLDDEKLRRDSYSKQKNSKSLQLDKILDSLNFD